MFELSKTRKVAIVATTAILSAALLGGIALGALGPTTDTFALVPGLESAPNASPTADRDDGSKVKAILDALVGKGVITQAQEDAILAALKNARDDKGHRDLLRRVFANLFEQSAVYLGMKPADLKAKLPGTSLGAVANATPGKSRDGLVASLTRAVDEAIGKALVENKITKDQADKAKAAAPDHLAKFVDHVYAKPQPRATTPRIQAFIGDAVKVANDYLGLSTKEVMAALRSGKSLGEIANSTSGKSRDGLIAAIATSVNAKIDKAATDGKVTAEQATQLRATVGSAITTLVDRKAPARAPKPASR